MSQHGHNIFHKDTGITHILTHILLTFGSSIHFYFKFILLHVLVVYIIEDVNIVHCSLCSFLSSRFACVLLCSCVY